MSILDSFDLNQHVVGATHRDGHTLDLIITRASDDGLVSNCRVGDCISGHFAVHCDLQFKKPPLERKEITCRKTCSIDFTDFCHKLSNSCLVLDPADDLEALVRQYNVTLKSRRQEDKNCYCLPLFSMVYRRDRHQKEEEEDT